jgi:hypothetical protein
MKSIFFFFFLVSRGTEGGKSHTVKLLLFAKKVLEGYIENTGKKRVLFSLYLKIVSDYLLLLLL